MIDLEKISETANTILKQKVIIADYEKKYNDLLKQYNVLKDKYVEAKIEGKL
jgi:hypothetical protein